MSDKRALVVDLSYQVHRYLSVPKMAELRTKDNIRVGGVFGVLKAINSALNIDAFSKVVCCMDSYPAFRKQIFPSYKSSRKNNPDSPAYKSYIQQDSFGWSQKRAHDFAFSKLQDILPKMKIQTIIQENVEGDDLVYHTCKYLTEQGYDCTAMSDDKDYLQLINLIPSLKVYRVIKDEIVTYDNFFDKIGVHPGWFIFYKAFLGDQSDEIPSVVKGFGEASIKKFVNEAYEQGIDPNSLEVYDKIFELSKNCIDKDKLKFLKKVTDECIFPLRKNMKLMDFRECPYGLNKKEELKEMLNQKLDFDFQYVSEQFKQLEFNSLSSILYSPIIRRLS